MNKFLWITSDISSFAMIDWVYIIIGCFLFIFLLILFIYKFCQYYYKKKQKKIENANKIK